MSKPSPASTTPPASSAPPAGRPQHYTCTTPVFRITKRRVFTSFTPDAPRCSRPGFLMLYRRTPATEGTPPCVHIGFTVSKKVGNATERNRAKRRLRALTDTLIRLNPAFSPPAHEHLTIVFIGRKPLLDRPFDALQKDLYHCLRDAGCRLKPQQNPPTTP